MNLSRKSGVAGLRGISKEKDKVLRPLLNFTKTDILNFSKEINSLIIEVKRKLMTFKIKIIFNKLNG